MSYKKKTGIAAIVILPLMFFYFHASSQLGSLHVISTVNEKFFDPPTLTPKSSETIGTTDVFTYAVSYMDSTVVKVFNEVKNSHKPGASIAFELSPFEIDQANLTVRVGIAKGQMDQSGLMGYLQKKLNYAFTPND